MSRLLTTLSVIALTAATASAQSPATTAAPAGRKPAAAAAKMKKAPLVEFEMMTWPEVKKAHRPRQDDGARSTPAAPSSAGRRTSTAATR